MRNARAAVLWTAGCVLVFILAPMAAPALLPMCVAPVLTWHWAAGRPWPKHRPSAVVLALALSSIYLLVNASWSLSPADAYRSVALLVGIAAAGYVLLGALSEADDTLLRAMTVGLLVAMVAGSAVICFEAFSGQAIRRLAASSVPALQGSPAHIEMTGGWVTKMPAHLLNRSTTALMLLFWPAVLAVDRLHAPRRYRPWLLAALVLTAAAIARSEHGTSKVAMVGAGAVYIVCRLLPAPGRFLVRAGWVALVVLVVPMAMLAYDTRLYQAAWLPPSAQHRIVIWGHTANQVAQAPLLGSGVSSARALTPHKDAALPKAPGSDFALAMALHTHNAYLQIWYETGAIGALLLLGLGLLILRAIATTPLLAQAPLHASFAAATLLAASSFSIWAPWFIAALGLASAVACVGAEVAARRAAAID